MGTSAPALLQVFPSLRERLPHHPFVLEPTPVVAWDLEGLPARCLHVKDDSRSSPLYGGNKPRKLEWILGAAQARGARRVLTGGGIGTHHGLATTILARAAGLATTLVLVDQPLTEHVRETLLLQAAWGAEQRFGGSLPGAAREALAAFVRAGLRRERPWLVPPGGSSARGTLGFVSAGLELAAQVRAGALPEPSAIYVPVGTGGTAAGLIVGLRLAGLRARVVGVLVNDILPPSPGSLVRLARAALRMLRHAGADVPPMALAPDDFPLLRDQLGPGYGVPTPAAERAQAVAAEAGLDLETTYGAKAMAALLEGSAAGALPEGPLLFWHTCNAVDVRTTAPGPPDPERLPPRLRRRLARG